MTMFQMPPLLQRWLFPALAAALAYAAWRSYGWPGLILAVLMLSFWLMLHFTKLMRLLRTVADRPMGRVSDANALAQRLKQGMPLVDVMRMTLSIGLLRSSPNTDPEVRSWSDEAGRTAVCTFEHGRLVSFRLEAEGAEDQPTAALNPTPAPADPAP
ncbi:MAG: glycerate kinase [Hydrogenophaga sp.]